MIGEHKIFMFATFYVILSFFENFNNGQKFTIVSFVLSLD